MASLSQDFTMISGDTKYLDYTITMTGTLSGSTAKWVLYKNGVVALTKTTTAGISITGDTTLRVTLSPADTASLSGVYKHELQITDVSTNVCTVALGTVSIKADYA